MNTNVEDEYGASPTLSEQRTILARARELIDLYWCRGVSQPTEKNNCAIIAIVRASGDLIHRWQPVVQFVQTHNRETLKDREGRTNLGSWNDTVAKNKEEVLALFDKTLAIYTQQLAQGQ